jgi:hypothetical protein
MNASCGINAIAMFDWPETAGSASVMAEFQTKFLSFFTSGEFQVIL